MADQKPAEFYDLLHEHRAFAPPADFKAHAAVRDERIYADAERDPEAFWAQFADELEWSRRALRRGRLRASAPKFATNAATRSAAAACSR